MASLRIEILQTPDDANEAAAELLAEWLLQPGVRNAMLAAGNTPLELYRRIGSRGLRLDHLSLHALDEYVGVPVDEPRNCANLILRTAVEPWGIPKERYFSVSSDTAEAERSVLDHERRIENTGGLDVVVLGLGQNGHLGFNEPGSTRDCGARVLDLDPISIEANRKWFAGDHAPSRGATVGMRTLLSARRVLVMAYGLHKAAAVKAMILGPSSSSCPASFLKDHPHTTLFLDTAAAVDLLPEMDPK